MGVVSNSRVRSAAGVEISSGSMRVGTSFGLVLLLHSMFERHSSCSSLNWSRRLITLNASASDFRLCIHVLIVACDVVLECSLQAPGCMREREC